MCHVSNLPMCNIWFNTVEPAEKSMWALTALQPMQLFLPLDFHSACKLLRRDASLKSPLWSNSKVLQIRSPLGIKKKLHKKEKRSDLVCRFWRPISTFTGVSFITLFHWENVFFRRRGIWMRYIIQRGGDQPIRKVIYFSQRKCCYYNAQVSNWRCAGLFRIVPPRWTAMIRPPTHMETE